MNRCFLIAVFLFAGVARADILWLGNDTIGNVFATNTTGVVTHTVPGLPVTGIAWDGASLYFADRAGNFTRRTPDGATVLGSFTVLSGDTGEDLAWDSRRSAIWRIVHTNLLQEIDPIAGVELTHFNLPTADPVLGTLGGLGIAYDSRRDLLYVSYCAVGCSSLAAGLVQTVDPSTGTVLGDLFRTAGFGTGGLGYDALGDTLWVGDLTEIRDMSLGGAVLSSFVRPQPAGFTDGLELVQAVPEPGTLALLAACVAALACKTRLRRVR